MTAKDSLKFPRVTSIRRPNRQPGEPPPDPRDQIPREGPVSAFTLTVELTGDDGRDRNRVHRILSMCQDELAAGRRSGGIWHGDTHIGSWGFTR